MKLALVNGRVLTDQGFADGLAVVLEEGRISAVLPMAELEAGTPRRDLDRLFLAPGFIDTQVNGGGGVLFNDSPTVEGIRAIGAAHRMFGTTGFFPTLISDDFTVIEQAFAAVRDAMDQRTPGVLGVHVEGPFLNPERKGIHDPSKFRTLDEEAVSLLKTRTSGRTLVTLAPELASPALIRSLVEAGVVVAAGHTNGSYASIREALDAGVSGFTHLFNAMSPLKSREPGAVGAALESGAWCGLIVDGHHVHPATLRIALRSRPTSRFMLVSDAMPSVGAAEKGFLLQNRPIFVQDGVCRDANGVLAGSDLSMAEAVRNTRDLLDGDLAEACRMASRYPAEFMGLGAELGRIAPGCRADLVAFDEDVRVAETWIGGANGD